MNENIKLFSEMERYEIINLNDGERYNYLSNNDIIIDEQGNLKLLILSTNPSKFTFFNNNEVIEVPWECVKKIGARTIIIDADEQTLKKARL
jgi:YlmC/YmxH family sporulation protein